MNITETMMVEALEAAAEATETAIETAVQDKDILVPKLAVTHNLTKGEIAKVEMPEGKSTWCAPLENANVIRDVMAAAQKYAYPPIFRGTADKTFDANSKEEIEKGIDEIATDLVQQKEELFFWLVNTVCKNVVKFNLRDDDIASTMLKAKMAVEDTRAMYVNAGAMKLLTNAAKAGNYLDLAVRHQTRKEGQLGKFGGVPIYTNAFRDEDTQQPAIIIAFNKDCHHFRPDPVTKAHVAIFKKGNGKKTFRVYTEHFAAMVFFTDCVSIVHGEIVK